MPVVQFLSFEPKRMKYINIIKNKGNLRAEENLGKSNERD
jgi:hypothetical protein